MEMAFPQVANNYPSYNLNPAACKTHKAGGFTHHELTRNEISILSTCSWPELSGRLEHLGEKDHSNLILVNRD